MVSKTACHVATSVAINITQTHYVDIVQEYPLSIWLYFWSNAFSKDPMVIVEELKTKVESTWLSYDDLIGGPEMDIVTHPGHSLAFSDTAWLRRIVGAWERPLPWRQ